MIYQSDTISVEYTKPGIARFTFAAAGSVNKFDQQTLTDCKTALDKLHALPVPRTPLLLAQISPNS